nr:MAG TPA: hypothetical protein [Caudoviricetes sp.]
MDYIRKIKKKKKKKKNECLKANEFFSTISISEMKYYIDRKYIRTLYVVYYVEFKSSGTGSILHYI